MPDTNNEDKKVGGLKTLPMSELGTKRFFLTTVSLMITWSVAAFSFYFCEFYMKYLDTSVFFSAFLMGISDILSSTGYYFLAKIMQIKNVLATSFFLLLIASISMAVIV